MDWISKLWRDYEDEIWALGAGIAYLIIVAAVSLICYVVFG